MITNNLERKRKAYKRVSLVTASTELQGLLYAELQEFLPGFPKSTVFCSIVRGLFWLHFHDLSPEELF